MLSQYLGLPYLQKTGRPRRPPHLLVAFRPKTPIPRDPCLPQRSPLTYLRSLFSLSPNVLGQFPHPLTRPALGGSLSDNAGPPPSLTPLISPFQPPGFSWTPRPQLNGRVRDYLLSPLGLHLRAFFETAPLCFDEWLGFGCVLWVCVFFGLFFFTSRVNFLTPDVVGSPFL